MKVHSNSKRFLLKTKQIREEITINNLVDKAKRTEQDKIIAGKKT